jgi:hypothetical protein
MATVTRQARSRSRSRPASKPSQPARSLNRIRTNAYFSDPDYDQTTPEPKTASTPSPTWGKLQRKNNFKTVSSSTATENSRIRHQEEPSDSLARRDDRRNAMSSFCAPPDRPSENFKDRISPPNLARAKAMASPNFRQRSTSRPKRVEILSDYDREDEEERMRLQASPTWRKKRPDTPTSARVSIFDFPSKTRSWSSLEGFVPQSGFIWLVLIFLAILLGLSSSPEIDLGQVAPKEVCGYFRNPAEWDCAGSLNYTIHNVVSYCHNAADTIYNKFETSGAKTNIEDLMHTCQDSIDYGTDKLKRAPAKLQSALCYLPGAEAWDGCAKKPVSTLTKTLTKFGSVISEPFGSTNTKSLGLWTSSSRRNTVSTITVRKSTSITPTTDIENTDETTKSVFDLFASEAGSYVTSKLSSASSAYLPFTSSSSTNQHTMPVEAEPTVKRSSVSDAIEAVSEIKDLELKYTLAVAKAELKMLQTNDTSIIRHTTYTKRHLNALLNTAWSLTRDIDGFVNCMDVENGVAVSTLSRKISYGSPTESWGSYFVRSMRLLATSPDAALGKLIVPHDKCRKHLVRMDKAVTKALRTREGLLREIDRLTSLSYRHDFRKRKPLYIPVPLPWFRALGPFPHLPVINLPTIHWHPRDWFLGEDYWWRKRSLEDREEGLKLHRLRMALHRVRSASDGFGDVKNLLELGIGNLTDARKELQSHRQQVLENPEFELAFLKGKVQDVNGDRSLAVQLRAERKRVVEQINAEGWHRYGNGNDEFGAFLAEEIRL